jgi:hypothetical protein
MLTGNTLRRRDEIVKEYFFLFMGYFYLNATNVNLSNQQKQESINYFFVSINLVEQQGILREKTLAALQCSVHKYIWNTDSFNTRNRVFFRQGYCQRQPSTSRLYY